MSDFGFTPTANPSSTPQAPQGARSAQRTASNAVQGRDSLGAAGTADAAVSGFAQFILDALTPTPEAQAESREDAAQPVRQEGSQSVAAEVPQDDWKVSDADEKDAQSEQKANAPDPAAMILALLGQGRTSVSPGTANPASAQADRVESSSLDKVALRKGRLAGASNAPVKARADGAAPSEQKTPAERTTVADGRTAPAHAAAELASSAQRSAGSPAAQSSAESIKPAVEAPTAVTAGTPTIGLALPGSAVDSAGTASAASANPTMDIQLSPGLDRPEFKSALGVQVAVLFRQGVEQARLQLNPAEMGPVAIRLLKQGQDVRVDMAADLAQTRQVLEQSLPALAQALKEAGFTLAGGGVQAPSPSEQGLTAQDSSNPNLMQQGQGQGDGSGNRGQSTQAQAGSTLSIQTATPGLPALDEGALSTRMSPRERVVSLVDLYA